MSKTYGIVLSWIKYKESSKIVTILTEDLGKVSIMAQGALKPRSQLLAVTEVFCRSHFELKKGKSLYYVESAELESSNYGLRQDINRLAYGFYALELVEKTIPEGEPSPKIFAMLQKVLESISSSKSSLLPLTAFEIKVISMLGYRPQISACIHCGKAISEEWTFSIHDGGLVCRECSNGTGFNVDRQLIVDMRNILMSKFEDLPELRIDEERLENIHSLLYQYIIFSLDIKELKSETMIRRTRSTGTAWT